jgi:hypothetical protein
MNQTVPSFFRIKWLLFHLWSWYRESATAVVRHSAIQVFKSTMA